MNKRYTAEQILKYQNDPNIKEITENRLRFTLEYRKRIYDAVCNSLSHSTIAEFLKNDGYDDIVRDYNAVHTLHRSFITNGKPKNGERSATSKMYHHDKNDDALLLATGRFQKSGNGIAFTDDFISAIYHNYPELSIEDSIRAAGIDPELVGYQRIINLKRKFDHYETVPQSTKYSEQIIKKYSSHPYVKRITSKQFTLKECFYNETCYFTDMKIDDILDMYCIDHNDLSVNSRNMILYKLSYWKHTEDKQEDFSSLTVQIQKNRLLALQKLFEGQLEFDGKLFRSLSCKDKRDMCMVIHSIPTDPEGYYSVTRILNIASIPRTTYYEILRNDNYGKYAEKKEEQDCRDIEIIRTVINYKSFGKGSRQIYMDMKDITGVQFGLKKIRRLMKKAGIETSIRKKNRSRQAVREMLKNSVKPNLLKRTFKLHEPNEVRLTDVTYLDFGERKRAYASACKDPVTGKLLDFTVSMNNDLSLVMKTLENISDDRHSDQALFHSDQGALYLTRSFQDKVKQLGFEQSMSKRGNCWDNAPQESYFGHFKDECDYKECRTFEELDNLCQKYKDYYNNERRQWNLNKMTPVQYEQYLLCLSDEQKQERIRKETEKYETMKKKAAEEAVIRATTLGV